MTSNPWLMLFIGALFGYSILSGGEKTKESTAKTTDKTDDQDPL